MLVNIMRTVALVGLTVLSLNVSGCAHISVPAPEGFVKPISEPVIETSTINLPITVSVSSVVHDLGQRLSQDNGRHSLGLEGVNDIVAGKIQGFLQKHASKIDSALIENVYLQQGVKKAWEALQGPIKLRDDLYLLLDPQTVHVSPLTEQGDSVKVVAGLVAKPKLIAGNLPAINARTLPNISASAAQSENGFHIALENELSFDFISSELTKRLRGRAYPVVGDTIIIQNVRVYGADDSMIVAVTVRGTVQGTIYLTGVPAYDASTQTLQVRNLEYTVETKHVLAKAAEWLLHTRLRDSLAEQATWFVGDKLEATKDLLSGALNRHLNQHVSISGTIHAIRPGAVGMTDTSLKVVLVLDGTAEMNVF